MQRRGVTTRCTIILLSIFGMQSSLSVKETVWHCAALTESNATNFCLCYFKLPFPAAILAVTSDSGIGLETTSPGRLRPDPAPFPQTPKGSGSTAGSGPELRISRASPWNRRAGGIRTIRFRFKLLGAAFPPTAFSCR